MREFKLVQFVYGYLYVIVSAFMCMLIAIYTLLRPRSFSGYCVFWQTQRQIHPVL